MTIFHEFKILHIFSGAGGAALGFQRAREEWQGLAGRFRTLAGIDVDPEACEDFENLTSARAIQMDLFERRDYIAFHGKEPPADWREVTPSDLREAVRETPDVIFLSPPCKGFSALLPQKAAGSEKYQALNRLVPRGLFLSMEAWRDNLPAIIFFENVPRITSRGKDLLHTVKGLLNSYGYVVSDGFHDCGEIGGLAQHRKRYLLIARLPQKVTSFVYKPFTYRIKAIGEVIGPLPLPNDPVCGPMHRLPRLQWKTWVRLALIPAGGDWRDLEEIAPEQYKLQYAPRGSGPFGVQEWNNPGATVIGHASVKGSNAVCVGDPRLPKRDSRHPGVYRVVRWDDPGPCVTGSRFGSGKPAVADLRFNFKDDTYHSIYRVSSWDRPAKTVTGALGPNNGATVIADSRSRQQNLKKYSNKYEVVKFDEPAVTVAGIGDIHSDNATITDLRIPKDTDRLDPPPVIISIDGTWHRPLTTYELAIIQGFPTHMPNGRPLTLAGKSDARKRERIGNAVPPAAAQEIGETVLRALLPSLKGAWVLAGFTNIDIWVLPKIEVKDQALV